MREFSITYCKLIQEYIKAICHDQVAIISVIKYVQNMQINKSNTSTDLRTEVT